MTQTTSVFNGEQIKIISLDTVIVGTGAAGYNAALRLKKYGRSDIAIVTEGIKMGTSRNTGSDKQTYYKMNLCADYPDSPKAMASDLVSGGSVDGDTAYAEAALSVPCFIQLCELGVPFPVNRYGEYVGYKTDHDPRARATSAGPLTSKLMTECLERAVKAEKVCIFDGLQAISVITDGKKARGILALNKRSDKERLVLFNASNVIFATGGPAGIYESSVYPLGHSGCTGVIFEAGAKGRNLTEWQYGLASTSPRWNVSGTYMQVLPRFVSVDKDGNEYEFLNEHFKDIGECLFMIFKKGYEWPFDSRKLNGGSSVIDLLVYRETVMRGRRVYLDFRSNPNKLEKVPFECLDAEAYDYLSSAGALYGKPIDRLLKMNEPAYELYLSKGVDLKTDMLEIDLCAQHNNGGVAVNMWWESDVESLFVVGEAAGTHGIYRPGGSALNAGQVGSMRAAQYISNCKSDVPLSVDEFIKTARPFAEKHVELMRSISSDKSNVKALMKLATSAMSGVGGAIRTYERMQEAQNKVESLLSGFANEVKVDSRSAMITAYRLRDVLMAQRMYLSAMRDFAKTANMSRGSALYTSSYGVTPVEGCDIFTFVPYDGSLNAKVQEVCYGDECTASWRDVVPLPEGGGFFENVWADYRKNKNIY